MEKKPIVKRPLTRVEKIHAPVPKLTFFQTFKQNLLSKTCLTIFGIGVVVIFGKTVAKPLYDEYKMKKAEEMANVLWEKEYKHSVKND